MNVWLSNLRDNLCSFCLELPNDRPTRWREEAKKNTGTRQSHNTGSGNTRAKEDIPEIGEDDIESGQPEATRGNDTVPAGFVDMGDGSGDSIPLEWDAFYRYCCHGEAPDEWVETLQDSTALGSRVKKEMNFEY